MKKPRIFLVLCLAILLVACSIVIGNQTTGSGKVITERRTVGNFTKLENTCSVDVDLVQGSPLAVSIEGEDNILPLIETRVSGGTLTISTKQNTSYRTTKKLIVHITAPEMSSIRVTSSGDVEMDAWQAGSIEIESTSSGDINIGSLQADSLQARLSSSGDITISSGKVASQTIRVTSSGNFKAENVESRTVEATLTSSGDVTVWATESLSASLSSSGNLQYYGNPRLTQKETSSGSVKKLGDQP